MPSIGLHGLEEVRKNWIWFLLLGVLLTLMGLAAFVYAIVATEIVILVFGWLLLGSGLVQAVLAVQGRTWSGFSMHLLGGILELMIGMLVIAAPLEAAAGLTLLLAAYLLVGGLFRMIVALSLGFAGSGWIALGGLVSFVLGIALWRQWPTSGLWFIGACVGIDLIWHGAAWVAFALTVRRLPTGMAG